MKKVIIFSFVSFFLLGAKQKEETKKEQLKNKMERIISALQNDNISDFYSELSNESDLEKAYLSSNKKVSRTEFFNYFGNHLKIDKNRAFDKYKRDLKQHGCYDLSSIIPYAIKGKNIDNDYFGLLTSQGKIYFEAKHHIYGISIIYTFIDNKLYILGISDDLSTKSGYAIDFYYSLLNIDEKVKKANDENPDIELFFVKSNYIEKKIKKEIEDRIKKINNFEITKEVLETGKQIYLKNCTACHSADGGGLIGPNLTDDYWIYGNTFYDVFETISNGTGKVCPPWKSLGQKKIQEVTAYVMSLKGTKPANPKGAEGKYIK